MAGRELIFDIFAIDRASAVFRRVAGEAEGSASTVAGAGRIMAGSFLATGVALGAIAYESIKTSAEMQTAMGRLVSTAGETKAGVQVVWSGIDTLAGQVGFSVTKLGEAMYYAESGGYHAADAMTVLAAAAKGAKVENADVTEVTHAVTGAMRDYGMSASQAAEVTNAMTTAVGHGMMTFNDLAEAFPHVGARAKAANVTLEETLSAISRMTADGLPASVAATYLGQTIGQLAAPSSKARTEMRGLGIDATHLSQTLTSGSGHGLGDAITILYKGITDHLSPAGLVAVETFKKSAGSASNFQSMLANLPPSMQTTVQALATMGGGVKSFQGLVMLGQDGLKGYKGTLADVNKAAHTAGQTINGFAEQQATLNGKIGDFKGAMSGLADQLGKQLTPAATWLMGNLADLATWLSKKLPAAIAVVNKWFSDHKAQLTAVGSYITGTVIPAVRTFATAVGNWLVGAFQAIKGWIAAHQAQLSAVWGYITGTVIPIIKDFASNIKDGLVMAFQFVMKQIDAHMTQIKQLGVILAALGAFIIQYVVPAIGVILKGAFVVIGVVIGVVIDIIAAIIDVFREMIGVFAKIPLTQFDWARNAAASLDAMKSSSDSVKTSLEQLKSPPPIVLTADASQVYGTLANIQRAAQTGININAKMAAMPGHATGTMNFAGGLTTINERGPEVVNLPSGSQILTADQSAKMVGKRGPVVQIQNYYEGGNTASQVASELAFLMRSA
jgi:TP901 family phage tail tape measure protein